MHMFQNEENVSLYLRFVNERHSIWTKRQAGDPAPWTDDKVLAAKKFTNVFRILDHGSQFLTSEMLWTARPLPEEEILMRAFLYRYINRPEPFIYFFNEHGRYPLIEDLRGELQASWERYGGPFFGSAYTMFCGAENAGMTRIGWAMGLVAQSFLPESSGNITRGFFDATSQEGRFRALQEAPRCADFMAMQILTDWGYSMYGGDCDENEFIAPGPGSKVGIRRLEPTELFVPALREVHEFILAGHDDIPFIPLPNGGRHLPSIMDIQNTFCEFGKYMRYLEKGAYVARKFKPAHPERPKAPFLPEHWLSGN